MSGPAVIVQAITTHWTTAARGAPLAAARAAVPEAAVLPAGGPPGPGTALVHTLEAREEHGFALEEVAVDLAAPLPFSAFGVRIAAEDGLVVVTGLKQRWAGWPPRDRDRVLLRLAPGEWGRCLRNRRVGGAHEWTYTKVVVDVAHLSDGEPLDPRRFVDRSPTRVVDEQAQLR